ncbi:MAG TPA: type II secretion system F family protein [Bdellovibrionota bacterium]|jgi:tight adherence protein B|nr:type II secretion system F family protein [Bdellovibrionota bacterium]
MNGTFGITLVAGTCFFLAVFMSYEYWAEKIGGILGKTTDRIVELSDQLFNPRPREEVMRQQMMIGGGLAFVFFVLMWSELMISIPVAIGAFFVGWRLPLIHLEKVVRPNRISAFSSQMVDGLTLMSNALKSGLNVPQALHIVASEMPNPISQEFGLVLNQNKVGLSLEKAFDNLALRIPTEDVNMFVTSVNILKETGGNVAETFETIVHTIRERLKIENKIKAMTAQGMTSAVIVSILPWGLAAVLYSVDPQMMRPLFVHPLGWAILGVIILLQAIGFFVVKKLVTIRV